MPKPPLPLLPRKRPDKESTIGATLPGSASKTWGQSPGPETSWTAVRVDGLRTACLQMIEVGTLGVSGGSSP